MDRRFGLSTLALALASMPPSPPAIRLSTIEGGGEKSVTSIHAKIVKAKYRRYDIHKIGAKTRARMAKAAQR